MWTVIYVAPNRKIAEHLRDALNKEGILVDLRSIEASNEYGMVEMLVPESEAEEAQEIMNQALVSGKEGK